MSYDTHVHSPDLRIAWNLALCDCNIMLVLDGGGWRPLTVDEEKIAADIWNLDFKKEMRDGQ